MPVFSSIQIQLVRQNPPSTTFELLAFTGQEFVDTRICGGKLTTDHPKSSSSPFRDYHFSRLDQLGSPGLDICARCGYNYQQCHHHHIIDSHWIRVRPVLNNNSCGSSVVYENQRQVSFTTTVMLVVTVQNWCCSILVFHQKHLRQCYCIFL